jgi:hypothetical protein
MPNTDPYNGSFTIPEEPAPMEGGGWCRGARAHPAGSSIRIGCPFRHNCTLEHNRLPSVTATVTSWQLGIQHGHTAVMYG